MSSIQLLVLEPREYEENFPRSQEMEGKKKTKGLENKEEEQLEKSESAKKIRAAIKCLYLSKGLFLARWWTVCFLFYLNNETGIFEVEEIYIRNKEKWSH